MIMNKLHDQINKKKLRNTVSYETPSRVEFQFNGGVVNDSNPVTKRRVQNDPVDEVSRVHLDMRLNINPYIDNDFILQLKTRFISDRLNSDPITKENDENNSALLLSSLEIPSYVISRSTRTNPWNPSSPCSGA